MTIFVENETDYVSVSYTHLLKRCMSPAAFLYTESLNSVFPRKP